MSTDTLVNKKLDVHMIVNRKYGKIYTEPRGLLQNLMAEEYTFHCIY